MRVLLRSVFVAVLVWWSTAGSAAAGVPGTPTAVPTPATPIPCGQAAPPLCAGGDCGGGISSCQPDPFGAFCVCEPPTPPPPTPTPAALDAFTCYRTVRTRGTAKLAGIPNPPGVTLTDELGTSTVEIKRSRGLCAPTDPDDERPGAALHVDHLKRYPIKNTTAPVFPSGVRVVDRFNPDGLFLDVGAQSHLLMPAAKSLAQPPPPPVPAIDHFECYEVTPARRARKFTRVRGFPTEDQFGALTLDVWKPKHLCNAVDKNGEGVLDPGAHLLCYRVRQVDRERFTKRSPVFVADQLGSETLDVTRPLQLCVPAATATVLPTDLVGTYDYTAGAEALAVIRSAAGSLSLKIEIQPGNYVSGPLALAPDGSVSMNGIAISGGDIILGPASVSGTSALIAGTTIQIAGTVTSGLTGAMGAFTMTRPLAGTPPALGGTRRFTFAGLSAGVAESTATLELIVPATGIGQSSTTADETDAGENVLGTFSPGECLVSPLGKLSCVLPYVHQVPPPASFPIPAFNAQIAGDLATGGTVYGDTPPISHAFPIATWTAGP